MRGAAHSRCSWTACTRHRRGRPSLRPLLPLLNWATYCRGWARIAHRTPSGPGVARDPTDGRASSMTMARRAGADRAPTAAVRRGRAHAFQVWWRWSAAWTRPFTCVWACSAGAGRAAAVQHKKSHTVMNGTEAKIEAACGRLPKPLSLVGASLPCVEACPRPGGMLPPRRTGRCRPPRSPAPGRGSSAESAMPRRHGEAPLPERRTARSGR